MQKDTFDSVPHRHFSALQRLKEILESRVRMLLLFRRFFSSPSTKMSFEHPRTLFKWLFLSILIGLGVGTGIIIFYEAVRWFTEWGLGWIVGYVPPAAVGEGSPQVMSFWSASRPWLLPLVTTLGGLVAGIVVFTLAPEAEGHGTDKMITNFHQGRQIRWFAPLVKLFMSALLIGTGGSAGPEGPAGQIGVGFGSLLSRWFRLDTQDQRIAMASGMGAGVGAIFRAPLGGAVFATEILYKDDLEQDALIPALIASIVSYSVFAAWIGWNTLFTLPVTSGISSPLQLVYYVILGVLCGGVGVLMERTFHAIEHFFQHLHLPRWLKPALGGLIVGLIGLAFPQILGMSYGWVQVAILGTGIFSFSLLLLLLLPFLKILATSFSLGSGGPGGLFGPGMVIGGLLGAAVWRISFHWLPGLPTTPTTFILISMMALFGSISRAPLAMMLMVAEMSGNLSLLAPAMLAVGVAYLVIGQHTMYPSQPETRADSPAHRWQMSFPLLTLLTVQQAMRPLGSSLQVGQTIAEAAQVLQASDHSEMPVFDSQKRLVGALSLAKISQVLPENQSNQIIEEVMTRDVCTCSSDMTLYTVLERMITKHLHWLVVLDPNLDGEHGHLLGVLTMEDIIRQYQTALTKDSQQRKGSKRTFL
jgi:chloride channel protein, CIC family